MAKTAEDSAKEATKRKQDQQIFLKVQDTDLAAREAHYYATCRRDYTREDDRHQETMKDTHTKRKEKASFQQDHINIIFSTSFRMLSAESFRDKDITPLRKNYETGTFHASSL